MLFAISENTYQIHFYSPKQHLPINRLNRDPFNRPKDLYCGKEKNSEAHLTEVGAVSSVYIPEWSVARSALVHGGVCNKQTPRSRGTRPASEVAVARKLASAVNSLSTVKRHF